MGGTENLGKWGFRAGMNCWSPWMLASLPPHGPAQTSSWRQINRSVLWPLLSSLSSSTHCSLCLTKNSWAKLPHAGTIRSAPTTEANNGNSRTIPFIFSGKVNYIQKGADNSEIQHNKSQQSVGTSVGADWVSECLIQLFLSRSQVLKSLQQGWGVSLVVI